MKYRKCNEKKKPCEAFPQGVREYLDCTVEALGQCKSEDVGHM